MTEEAKPDPVRIEIQEYSNPGGYANPAPLGLACFGLTTLFLNLHNAGIWADFDSAILAMGLLWGGGAQIIAGICEYWRNNLFGLVAFTSYGSFWVVLCFIHLLPAAFDVPAPSKLSVAAFLFGWGIFTFFMTWGTFKAFGSCKKCNLHLLQLIFILLFALFMILAVANLLAHLHVELVATIILRIGGVEGCILGLLALYLSGAEMINEPFEKYREEWKHAPRLQGEAAPRTWLLPFKVTLPPEKRVPEEERAFLGEDGVDYERSDSADDLDQPMGQ